MVAPIGSNGVSSVTPQQRIAQIQNTFEVSSTKPAQTSGSGQTPVASGLTPTDGTNQADNKLADLAKMLGIDEKALLSALNSGDPTKVTSLITSTSLSLLSGALSGEESTGMESLMGGGSGTGSATPAELQSKISSLGRTGVQFDGLL